MTAILLIIVAGLFLAPLLGGDKAMGAGAKICIFIVLVASFDLLLGYTGILSFAHTMFFGIGAYGVAMVSSDAGNEYILHTVSMGQGWGSVVVGALIAALFSALLALFISIFSLRVRTIYFAMITLSVAVAVQTWCFTQTELTGGEDGINFRVPEMISQGTKYAEPLEIFGFSLSLDGQLVAYMLMFFSAIILFLFLLRVINSPFGRVLQCIRDNEFRAAAIGYRVVYYRAASSIIGAVVACLAGSLYALWMRYQGPGATMGFNIMMDILFMVVIGGMATMYGAVVGATVMLIAQNYLQDLLKILEHEVVGIPILSGIVHPDRWLLWMGIFFIIVVYNFPWGIVGKLRMRALGIK